MNIFVLDRDIERCAQYHCDQHVVKMILESAQMLCTALNKKGFDTPYKSTHPNHPCTLWVEHSSDNFRWLVALARALNDEYRYRFDKTKDHKSIDVISKIAGFDFEEANSNGPGFEAKGLTEFAQAMPDKYKVSGDAVTAYRRFYLGEKMHFAQWSKRPAPEWITREELQ